MFDEVIYLSMGNKEGKFIKYFDISQPLDKNPMPGHLSELQPVNAVNTKGPFFRASFGRNPRFQIQLDRRPLSPGTSRAHRASPSPSPRITTQPRPSLLLSDR